MENEIKKSARIGSVAFIEELGRIKSLKIRVDLIKQLILQTFIPSRRKAEERELSKKEFEILYKFWESILTNLLTFKSEKIISYEIVSNLESLLNEIVLKNNELYFVPTGGVKNDVKFSGQDLIKILEEEKGDGVYINENELFLEEYGNEFDFGSKWLELKNHHSLEGLRNTHIEDNSLLPLPSIVRDAFVDFLSKHRGLFHRTFASMKVIYDFFNNYKEMYTQNEINSILNFLSVEDDISSMNTEIYESIFYSYYELNDDREIRIVKEFNDNFARDFFKSYNDKMREMREVNKIKDVEVDFPALFYFDGNISNRKIQKWGIEFNIGSRKLTKSEKRFMSLSVQLRDYNDGTLSMGNKTFELINDDFIKEGRNILYRIKYLKDFSYTIDGTVYEMKKDMLGGYVSKKAFILEDVIILPDAKVMDFVLLSSGVVIDKGVTVKKYSRIYKYNFKVDEGNVENFNGREFPLTKENVKILER